MRLSNARRLQFLDMAQRVMDSRPPDITINGVTQRWYVYPKNKWRNIYVHRWLGDDVDKHLHDHEPDNLSVILLGRFLEHFHVKPKKLITEIDGTRHFDTYCVTREEGDIVLRLASTPHKYTLPFGAPVITAFFQGPRRRHWGFSCPAGWKRWEDYIDFKKGYGDRSGPGCGE